MSVALTNFKEKENELHEQLYNNIFVLTMEYQTTKEFDTFFKKDMFHKNNKNAFHHVIHFLLTILDPTVFKQRICWPILDNKMEIQFRNELMKYINDLPIVYEDSYIPPLQTSHLISPGGKRFVSFMYKLSQFVLLQHLKRENDDIILPIKADTDNTIASQQLDRLTALVDDNQLRLITKQIEFKRKYDKIVQAAREIIEQKYVVERMHFEVKKEFRDYQEEMKLKATNINILPFEQRIKNIDKKLNELYVKETDFIYCKDLVDALSMNKNILQYDSTSNVNLIELLESFIVLLKNNKHIFQYINNIDFSNNLRITEEIVEDLSNCYNRYENLNSNLIEFISKMEEIFRKYKYGRTEDECDFLYKVKKVYETNPYVNINK